MIIVTNRIEVVFGKMDDAFEWSDKYEAYLKKSKLAGPKWWRLREITGCAKDTSYVGVDQYPSLAELEEMMTKRSEDPEPRDSIVL